ncbi:YdbL family protein [Leeia sp. TBRC 13508]|uniref:YdbL family protein n=1 Tax=Leeia speluncae TaxID=2884804 RepID=A0ABS8DA45_9NEIS|nr:YdbL family protein [Leeia speluncae]MCB6184796.1 YdbL family protein [Leeia speluncae]
MKTMKTFFSAIAVASAIGIVMPAYAAADLDVNTPAVQSLTQSMKARTAKLAEYYSSGAVGFGKDGNVVLRDANLVPLPKRQEVNRLVSDENQDRSALYREIARANNHPEWEQDIRQTFAQRWGQRAQAGWWVQQTNGSWSQK